MKYIWILILAFSFLMPGCSNKQEKKTGTVPTPLTNIKVNKQYDKSGNLIRFDSSYSSYYSTIHNNPLRGDSILNLFKNRLNEKYSFSNQPYFNNLFFKDSLLKYDFYKKDFFSNRFRNNMTGMDSLFRDMDRIKNNFYKNIK